MTNTGSTTIAFTNIATTGDFSPSSNTCGGSLPGPVGNSCTISVTFKPTATGTRTGTLTVTDSDSTGHQSVSLSGTGAAAAGGVSLSPSPLAFGPPQNVYTTSSPQTITLTNNGSAPLNFLSIVASGDYAQTNNCASPLAVSTSCAINVTFTPTAAGTRTGHVTFNDTDSTRIQVVNTSGTGTTPASTVTVSPRVASLTFTQTQQFQASINGTVSTNVNWSVDGNLGGNAIVGTISPSGLYTPPNTAGSHLIMATSTADTTQSATVPLVVTDYAGTFTYHNDNARTGLNANETVLTTGNVNSAQFGKLFSYPVDGRVFAQPLYVENVNIPGQGNHNVVYAATEHDSVYAFDADGLTATPLWHVSFINPANGITPVPYADVPTGTCNNIQPEIGITGTPVIDPDSSTLYVVAKTKEVVNGVTQYVQRLHALDITTGAEKPNSPVVIKASVPGTGAGSTGGTISFSPLMQNQRPGLLFVNNGINNVVYIGWASHCDFDPYHGWIMGYDASTLQQVAVYNDSPNGTRAGVWMSGAGLAHDGNGGLFFSTGNGTFDANTGGNDYGDSWVKLSTSGGLPVADYFTPHNQDALSSVDKDLGSGGVLLLPDQANTQHTHLMTGSGKEGTIYLVDRDNMGKFNSSVDNVVQSLVAAVGGVWGMAAYWQNQVYYWGVNEGGSDLFRAFTIFGGVLSTVPVSQGTTQYAWPGPTPTISANGLTEGIAWVIQYNAGSAATLHAFDASRVFRELYNSTQAGTRDTPGISVKFAVPTVANGKVYVGTQTELDIYGLLP